MDFNNKKPVSCDIVGLTVLPAASGINQIRGNVRFYIIICGKRFTSYYLADSNAYILRYSDMKTELKECNLNVNAYDNEMLYLTESVPINTVDGSQPCENAFTVVFSNWVVNGPGVNKTFYNNGFPWTDPCLWCCYHSCLG